MHKSLPFLFIYAGVMFGMNFPLGKLAGEAEVAPALWAMLISVGASAFILPLMLIRGEFFVPRGAMLRYVVVSALISFFAANLLAFSAIAHVGAGYVGVMFALSPVCTLGASLLAGLRVPRALGVAGIVFGMGGAVLVALGRGGVGGAPLWALAALGIPMILAVGNVYRTLAWPPKAEPILLAFWTHLVAALAFALFLVATTGHIQLTSLAKIPGVTLIQMMIAGLTFPAFFRLQREGGPVMLSQMGYVAAATSMTVAVVVMGERYSLLTWGGAGLIAFGLALTLVDMRRPDTRPLAPLPRRARKSS